MTIAVSAVTVNITYKDGSRRSITGFALIPNGSHTWTGEAARAAVFSWNSANIIYGDNFEIMLKASIGGALLYEQGYRMDARGNFTGPANPQNPAPTPTPCPGSIPEGIGRQINAIASQEHIDPTLLSVTMRHESSFGTNMTPNERWEGRGRNRHLVGWDVGPMQLANNIWQKSPFIDGLSNPFGTFAMNANTHQHESFNGNFEENITVAARAFSMDILPRSKGNADAAGKYRGPGDYQGRYNQYIREAPGDRRQLNCLAGRP